MIDRSMYAPSVNDPDTGSYLIMIRSLAMVGLAASNSGNTMADMADALGDLFEAIHYNAGKATDHLEALERDARAFAKPTEA